MKYIYTVYTYITWLQGNMKFISSVEQDISQESAANE